MNELEQILSILKNMDSRMSNIELRITNIESDISDMKEDLEITRAATNYNGEKLEELTEELKRANVIS